MLEELQDVIMQADLAASQVVLYPTPPYKPVVMLGEFVLRSQEREQIFFRVLMTLNDIRTLFSPFGGNTLCQYMGFYTNPVYSAFLY